MTVQASGQYNSTEYIYSLYNFHIVCSDDGQAGKLNAKSRLIMFGIGERPGGHGNGAIQSLYFPVVVIGNCRPAVRYITQDF